MSFFSAILLILLTFALDQWSKFAIVDFFAHQEPPYVVTSFFSLILVGNPGISFGLMRMEQSSIVWLFIAAALVGCAIMFYHMWGAEPKERFGLALILGGGFGNLLDRALYGRVVDFIDLHVSGYHWYTFNIADCWIVLGASFILLNWLCFKKKNNEQPS